MAEFCSAVTTDLGIALSADLLIGEKIEFTKLVCGNGFYSDDDMSRTSLQKAEELRSPIQEFGFSTIIKVTDSCVCLKALISNEQMTEGYRMTEIGIYARKYGEEGDGILYSIAVAMEADFFPRYNGMVAVEILEEYYITVSDAAEVTIESGRGACMLVEDFEEYKKQLQEQLKALPRVKVGPKEKLDRKDTILFEIQKDTNKVIRILERDAEDQLWEYVFASVFEKPKERTPLEPGDSIDTLFGKIAKYLEDLRPGAYKDGHPPFVQMTEETYIPVSERIEGHIYGLITDKRGLIVEQFDRYIPGEEDPPVEKTLYGIETDKRTTAEEDPNPYVGIYSNVIHLDDGQEVERKPGMIYSVRKEI